MNAHFLRLIGTLLTIVLLGAPHRGPAQTFIIGSNWNPLDPTRFGGTARYLCDSILGITMYHGSVDPLDTGSTTNAIAWSRGSGGKYILTSGGTINNYSGAERIKYDAVPNPDTAMLLAGSLTRYYFTNRDLTVGVSYPPFQSVPTHWKVRDTSSPADTRVLWGNEFANEWRDPANTEFCIAMSLRVDSLPTGSAYRDSDVVTVHVREKHGDGTDTTFIVHVPYASIPHNNTDYVVLSPTFRLKKALDNYPHDSMIVEVFAKRSTPVYLKWVTLQDTTARNLRTAVDIGSGDSRYSYWNTTVYLPIESQIQSELAAVQSAIGASNLQAPYLRDEPVVSEYSCMGKVNAILDYAGITELGSPFPRRFLAHVRPKVYWPAIGNGGLTGATNITCQILPYLDKGLGQGMVEGNVPREACVNAHGDTTGWNIPTWRRYKTYYSGYLQSGQDLTSIKKRALSTAADTVFDAFDSQQGGNSSMLHDVIGQ
jgi:hypothetical protein